MSGARPRHPVRPGQRPGRHRRGDGRGARARRLLLQHQGAARLLRRAVRPPTGGWSPRPSTSRCTSAPCPSRWPRCWSTTREPGDVWILNDPYRGGTHLPDITAVAPVALDGEVAGFSVTRAHHSDVGGMSPGSMPADSRDIWQEGLVIPPLRLVRGGELDDGPARACCWPTCARPTCGAATCARRWPRTAWPSSGSPSSSSGAGATLVDAAFAEVLAYTERRTREAIGRDPRRHVRGAEGEIEGDGVADEDIPIAVAVTRRRRRAADRLRRHLRAGGGQRQLPAGRHPLGLPVRAAGPAPARRARQRGDVRAADRRGARGLARARPPAGRGGGRQRGDLPADRRHRAARAGPGRRPARAGPGDDEQPDHRRARLDVLRDDRRRPGRQRVGPGPVRASTSA